MGQRVLVVDGWAREHALVWQLARSSRVDKARCVPGNTGKAELAETVPAGVDDIHGLAASAA